MLNIEAMIAAGREKKEAMITAARESAYAGDVEEAEHLVGLLPNARRGEEVKNAYRTRVPVPAFRAILEGAWMHDHDEVQRAAGHKDSTLRKWFDPEAVSSRTPRLIRRVMPNSWAISSRAKRLASSTRTVLTPLPSMRSRSDAKPARVSIGSAPETAILFRPSRRSVPKTDRSPPPKSRYSSFAPSDGVTRGSKAKRLSRFWVLSLCTPFARSDTSLYLSRLRTSCGQGPCPRGPVHR